MAHPHAKEEKTHRRAKHHALGVRGEHDDEKAERLCRADGGSVVKTPMTSGKGDMPPKDESRYGGGADLPTGKPDSNEYKAWQSRQR
jgi:hypothetical protein